LIEYSFFFSGADGLDLGFQQAGFNVIWANEYDKNLGNLEKTILIHFLDKSIVNIPSDEVPEWMELLEESPCQSWCEERERN
jgi:DNA (cytosine-5)-methyltransferase 1